MRSRYDYNIHIYAGKRHNRGAPEGELLLGVGTVGQHTTMLEVEVAAARLEKGEVGKIAVSEYGSGHMIAVLTTPAMCREFLARKDWPLSRPPA